MNTNTRSEERTRFLNSEEGTIFSAGCFMLMIWIASMGILWHIGSAYWLKVLTMGFTHTLAGRAASIAHGTASGFTSSLTAGLAVYFDVMLMFIIYSLLVYSYKNFLERRFFKKHMKSVFESAQKSVTRFRRWKITGVFLFVWFPLWMTGIIAGSILGFLLGLRTWVNMTTVIVGSTTAVICWVYAYDKLFGWLGEINKIIPVTITAVIITFLAVMRIINNRGQKNT